MLVCRATNRSGGALICSARQTKADLATARVPGQHAHPHQVRMPDILQRDAFSLAGGKTSVSKPTSAVVHLNDGAQQAAVKLVKRDSSMSIPLAGGDGWFPHRVCRRSTGGKVDAFLTLPEFAIRGVPRRRAAGC